MESKVIILKHGPEADRLNIVPRVGEAIWTTDSHELWVGDGITAGGIKSTANIEVNYIPLVQKAVAGGIATLDANGMIPSNQLPPLAITQTSVVASEAEQLALDIQEGDVVVRTDESKTYIHNGGTAGTMADFTLLATPTDLVISVNGKTGVVSLTTTDIEEGSNLYFTSARVVSAVGGSLDDSAGAGATSSIWSASKITQELSNLNNAFIGLIDTPANFTGAAGFSVEVNAAGNGLVFVDNSIIHGGTF